MSAMKAAAKKPRKQRAKKSTKQSPEREKRILALIDEAIGQQLLVRQAENDLDRCKEEQKDAKDYLETQQKKLSAIIDEIEAIRDGKPLQGVLTFTKEINGHGGDTALIVLKLTDSLIEKLAEAEITTVGQLEKRMRDGGFVPGRIKGIGETAVDMVTDALMKWRTENPVKAPDEPKPDAPAAAEAPKAEGNGEKQS